MRSGRAVALGSGCAALLAAALPAPAAATSSFTPCGVARGAQCLTLPVPIDRTGAVPGTIALHAARIPSRGPRSGAIIALAGGPGQAALPLTGDFAKQLSAGLATRDLLVFDQRGIGQSGALSCPEFDRGIGSLAQAVTRCAAELGPRRAFYSTSQSVDDVEALRQADGVDRLTLYGVSYGTKVALEYARRYPSHVEALILDSVVPADGPDPLNRSSMRAVPRILRALCAGRCAGITPDPGADVAALVARLDGRPLVGPVYDASGRRHLGSLTSVGLLEILLSGDFDPTARAELPAAMRAALQHDPAPLLRLSLRLGSLGDAVRDVEADNNTLFLAASCADAPLPWQPTASPKDRFTQTVIALAGLPASDFAPFTRLTALGQPLLALCANWPAVPTVPATGSLPQVPTLVMSGDDDTRTPLEDAQAVAAQIPGATLVAVPDTAHAVLLNDPSHCATRALASLFAGRPIATCQYRSPDFSPTPVPPVSLAALRPARATHGQVGRTITATLATLDDAERQVISALLAAAPATPRSVAIGGLRGGQIRESAGGLRLTAAVYVPGVLVSGTVKGGRGRLSIGGSAAAHGTITLEGGGRLTASLGGRILRIRASAAVASLRPAQFVRVP